jgi:Holliday junction resolvase-like predicted endonuclease
VVDSNVQVDRGEIDILAEDRGQKVAIEVRTIRGGSDPIDAIDAAKRERVRRLAHQTGATRIDFVGIRLESDAVVVHWVPGGV